jgi:uncharacterized membrane protein|tara:strand:- start:1436 stop:2527 length:1092 start_codon:yes stop_codon:yes gene_type:complete
LGTLIGGIISLTVFSFSMVMVLLSQASAIFSPRLLPGLISDKRNQIVLGIYLGTIIFNIIVLISILPTGDEYTLNGFSVLMGIVFGVISLSMFVFFIHSISTGIQINNILDKIYDQTKLRIQFLIEQERQESTPIETDKNWNSLFSKKSGYYQGVNLEGLLTFIEENKLNVLVLPYKGKYLLNNMEIIHYDQQIDEDKKVQLRDFFIYSTTNSVSENYVMGIRQISEVGIKAMSPGINDPGTAVMTIDYLTELLALRMQIDETEVYMCSDGEHKVELTTVDFDELMYQCLAAYRQYCKHDIILMEKIVLMLKYLLIQTYSIESYITTLTTQLKIVESDIRSNIDNETDRDKLIGLINKSNRYN